MIQMFKNFTDTELHNIGLYRGKRGIEIVIDPTANIYHMTVGKHIQLGNGDTLAIVYEKDDGSIENWTFNQIDTASTHLAQYLSLKGYGKGDYIGIHTAMRPITVIAHMAVCKLNAVAVTLSQFYGITTLSHALNDCGAKCLLTTAESWESIKDKAPTVLPCVTDVLVTDSTGIEPDLYNIINMSSQPSFVADYGGANDPALLMYTSGSTGLPKGILHGHRVLASYRPSISLFYNMSCENTDAVFYSPSDWAWVGGLLDMVFPAWLAGRPIATSDMRFSQHQAYTFMAKHKVTHTFLAPTAIKRLAQCPNPHNMYDLSLQVICTGGEALASHTLQWAENILGVVCNEFYGMTEVNHLIGNCAKLYKRKSGSMGIAYPGHQVFLVDETATPVPMGTVGEIVTPNTAPTRYLGYLNNPEKQQRMMLGNFLRTFDLAVCDADGYFWYKGRSDDLIKSSGMRIGPTEIEACLLSHETVAETAVIGKPDADRGQIVKAFIRLKQGYIGDDTLVRILQNYVSKNLASYKVPREIAFVTQFAMTTTGKINRKLLRMQEKHREKQGEKHREKQGE